MLVGKELFWGQIIVSYNERDVLRQLRQPVLRGGLIVSEPLIMSYLATVYTSVRAWYSHRNNTPFALRREQEVNDLFGSGTDIADWRLRPMVAVLAKENADSARRRLLDLGYQPYYENDDFWILTRLGVKDLK